MCLGDSGIALGSLGKAKRLSCVKVRNEVFKVSFAILHGLLTGVRSGNEDIF